MVLDGLDVDVDVDVSVEKEGFAVVCAVDVFAARDGMKDRTIRSWASSCPCTRFIVSM